MYPVLSSWELLQFEPYTKVSAMAHYVPFNRARIRAVISDNDGCAQALNPELEYGDPEDHYLGGFRAIETCFGRPILERDSPARRELMGIDIKLVGEKRIHAAALPIDYEVWKKALDGILLALAPLAELAPNFVFFAQHLRDLGIPLGIASSSVQAVLDAKWTRFPEQRSSLACFVAGDDQRVKKGKPHPDLLLAACEDLGVRPEDCVYLGDSGSDMRAAWAAGMPSIAIPSGGRSHEYYEKAGASQIVNGFGELMQLFA